MGVAGSDLVQPHLSSAERVLWVGQPDASRRLSKTDVVAIPFSLLWLDFTVFWTVAALRSGGLPFALFGVPFVLMGLYVTVGRFFAKARIRSRTWYAVTDKRVLRLEHKPSGDVVNASSLERLPAVNSDLRADGSGSVVFGPVSRWNTDSPFLAVDHHPPGFFDIPDPAYVAALIAELQQQRPDR